MGESFWFDWFGLPLDKLKAIKEKEYNKLTAEQRAKLDELIAKKENESK